MFSLLTPSMEFIPEFKNFVKSMQQGLIQSFGSIKAANPMRSKRVGPRGTSLGPTKGPSAPAHNDKKKGTKK